MEEGGGVSVIEIEADTQALHFAYCLWKGRRHRVGSLLWSNNTPRSTLYSYQASHSHLWKGKRDGVGSILWSVNAPT